MGQAHTPCEKTGQSVWIGLDLHSDVESLKLLSFFFDFPHAAGKYEKFSILPYSRWSVDGETLEMKPGLPLLDEEGIDIPFFIQEREMQNRIDKSIVDIYSRQYLTVNSDKKTDTLRKESFPSEIINLFPESVTAHTEPCYWIKAVFPPHISIDNIHDMTVYINTFPVAQKSFYSVNHNAEGGLRNIIPLRTRYEGEYFIGMEQVSNSLGETYKILPFTTDGQNRPAGTYSIKRGGVERFDRRSTKEVLERVIHLLRDEVTSFASWDRDSLREIITEIEEGIRDLEIKYNDSPLNISVPNYLLLNRREDDDKGTTFLEYWATHGELGNDLRSGKMIEPSGSLPLVKNSSRLLNTTRGGKFPADVSGRMAAFRYVLTSRDHIFTHEDIENFLYKELGNKIIKAKASRGVSVSSKPNEGLIRTLDVTLTPSAGCESIITEMHDNLLVMLRSKSPDSFNYRIIIETKN